MVTTIAGGELDPLAADRVVATAEGNPLFLEQLLAVGAEGDLTTLPPSIEAVLAARIDQLEPGEREVLVHASVEGRSFHAGAVAELMTDGGRDAVGPALMGLVQKQLLRPDRPEFAGEDAFRFSHALIRDAAYSGMPKRLRGELHERMAGWLRTKPHVLDEILGYHLEQACRYRLELGHVDEGSRALAREAAERLGAAAQAALVRGDAAAAARLLERAVSLVPPEDPARSELLSTLGATLVEAGRLADADRVPGGGDRARRGRGRSAPGVTRPRRAGARAAPRGDERRRRAGAAGRGRGAARSSSATATTSAAAGRGACGRGSSGPRAARVRPTTRGGRPRRTPATPPTSGSCSTSSAGERPRPPSAPRRCRRRSAAASGSAGRSAAARSQWPRRCIRSGCSTR